MKKHSGFGKEPPKPDIEAKLIRYLTTNPKGVSTALMNAWIDSCSRGGGYTWAECDAAKQRLRDSGRIAFASGVWYLRGAQLILKDTE